MEYILIGCCSHRKRYPRLVPMERRQRLLHLLAMRRRKRRAVVSRSVLESRCLTLVFVILLFAFGNCYMITSSRKVLKARKCNLILNYCNDEMSHVTPMIATRLRKVVSNSMSRRSHSVSPPPPPPKRPRRSRDDHLTSDDFKNGVFLAPMVRSGARTSFNSSLRILILMYSVPTRLFALKHGATMVWGPEMVDKAILHTERAVDRMMPFQFTAPHTYIYL